LLLVAVTVTVWEPFVRPAKGIPAAQTLPLVFLTVARGLGVDPLSTTYSTDVTVSGEKTMVFSIMVWSVEKGCALGLPAV
jgi:hypothetical protein